MRIKLTSGQFDRLMLREQETRSKAILSEGIKEVLLGVAKLMEVNLTGLNKDIAERALSDETIMSEIKNTLESEEKVEELKELLEKKGVKFPDKLLAKNAKKIMDSYNKIAEENNLTHRLDMAAGNNLTGQDEKTSDSVMMS